MNVFIPLCLLLFYLPLQLNASHAEMDMNRFIMDHRFGLHVIQVSIILDGKTLPPLKQVKEEISQFLNNYPNQEDYWEIVNKKLLYHLLQAHPELTHVQGILAIEPNVARPFNRNSLVSIQNGEVEKQIFIFTIPDSLINNIVTSIEIEMGYDSQAPDNAYINFLSVNDSVQDFLKTHQTKNEEENALCEQIAKHLLVTYPSVEHFTITLKVTPQSYDGTRYCWKSRVNKNDLNL